MTTVRKCEHCGLSLPRGWPTCPHCGRPGRYHNVEDAADEDERAALEERYHQAHKASVDRGAADRLRDFESALGASKAVLSRPLGFLLEFVQADNVVYATYYKLMRAGIRFPAGEKWDRLRTIADATLFAGFEDEIRFAALSLDGVGVRSYGACSITLRDSMIAHRASVFEENTVLFVEKMGVSNIP